MSTALTDVVTLLAVLLGSITAGIMLVQPLRNGPAARRARRRRETVTAPAVRRWPSTSHTALWSTTSARRPWVSD